MERLKKERNKPKFTLGAPVVPIREQKSTKGEMRRKRKRKRKRQRKKREEKVPEVNCKLMASF